MDKDDKTFRERTFSQTLEAIAKFKGDPCWRNNRINQAAMGRYLGTEQTYIYRWLSGNSISQSNLEMISRRINLSFGQILGKEPIPGVDNDYSVVVGGYPLMVDSKTPFQDKFDRLEPKFQLAIMKIIDGLLHSG